MPWGLVLTFGGRGLSQGRDEAGEAASLRRDYPDQVPRVFLSPRPITIFYKVTGDKHPQPSDETSGITGRMQPARLRGLAKALTLQRVFPH